ncbi:hypothetical protein ANCCAN_29358, partial [Ancylostoma caninum]
MSTFRGCRSRLTNAINNLMRLVNAAGDNYGTIYRSTAAPEVQLRELQRRNADITNMKFNIETARDTFQDRYDYTLDFIKDKINSDELTTQFEQYWQDYNGDDVEAQANTMIANLEDLLIKERELADSILLEHKRTSTHFNTINNIEHTNHHRRGISPQDQVYSSPLEHLAYHSNHSPSPPSSVDLASVQLRKVELPTFDGDFAMYYDFWAKFKAAVHDNPNLTTAAKFIHLANSLKGSAALVVQGYDITDPANYHLAVEALWRY